MAARSSLTLRISVGPNTIARFLASIWKTEHFEDYLDEGNILGEPVQQGQS
jgi:hypothetical protein